jgi:hypothetical protein
MRVVDEAIERGWGIGAARLRVRAGAQAIRRGRGLRPRRRLRCRRRPWPGPWSLSALRRSRVGWMSRGWSPNYGSAARRCWHAGSPRRPAARDRRRRRVARCQGGRGTPYGVRALVEYEVAQYAYRRPDRGGVPADARDAPAGGSTPCAPARGALVVAAHARMRGDALALVEDLDGAGESRGAHEAVRGTVVVLLHLDVVVELTRRMRHSASK